MNYFHRQIQLWGEDVQNSLQDKKVLIVGSGGLGSSFAYALGASGIGKIEVVDFDRVSISNIHRQILFDLNDDGKFKAEIFKDRVEARFKGVNVKTHLMKFEEFSKTCTDKFDLILDATDNLETRYEISKFAQSNTTPWIFSATQSFHGQVCFMKNASFKPLFKTGIKPEGIACPIVMFIASFASNLALRYLAGFDVKFDILHYFDISSGELKLSKFKI
ncbi:ThiF family adenylyltransferase [Campylobacter sp. FMV-PI01]|uniref:ThiF family adenylyltransferase n=1 Tax=Campylobacter portucalensis TaxID=2608384 RepID=A0A6L5WH58_9BACT|nr:ThiF family adenylyltransferase [Campylobacter portucalensis]MSN96520.1 ThiF family adenylyltransferase [Campylobacter portucalensis]